MKKALLLSLAVIVLMINNGYAQPPVKVRNGLIYMDDGSLSPNQKKYPALTDSLDKNLKSNPNDTISLFYRSVLLLRYNSMMAKPSPADTSAFNNLMKAAKLVKIADSLQVKSLLFKVLRAEIYREICYRFQGDQSWKYNASQVALRRRKFNDYKELANQYYNELILLDKNNAYTFEKLKVSGNYPIR
jgi:hypothetical protein